MMTFFRSTLILLIVFCLALVLSGCRSSDAAPETAETPEQASTHVPPNVQSKLLYKQAQSARMQHHYKQAAEMFEKLASSPGFTEEDKAFCTNQHQLCLDKMTPEEKQQMSKSSSPKTP
jgi:hypothetical protein